MCYRDDEKRENEDGASYILSVSWGYGVSNIGATQPLPPNNTGGILPQDKQIVLWKTKKKEAAQDGSLKRCNTHSSSC